MTVKEYLEQIREKAVNESKAGKIQEVYGCEFPEMVRKIVSACDETVFLDGDKRMLSFVEIINAERELHVDFKNKHMIPVMDCGDNDFVVYHFNDDVWSMFNIVDETIFKKRNSFEDMI